ncbi:MAG: response regulator [Lachnospiraceae bacterium]|nr:response regulator [Lachnospiraceae bacterium]
MYNILVVDDTEINLMMTERLLEGMPVSLDTATGGEGALVYLRQKAYDLCLFDYQMPGMSGIELLNAMREMDGVNSDCKVVAMTGTEDDNAADFFLDLGFDEFVRKPLKKEDLFLILFEMLDDPIFDEGVFEISQEELEKIPEGIREIGDIDYVTGVKNAGSAEDFISAIKIFCRAIDQTSDEIEKAFDRGDMKTYTIKVHGLKSTARMVGAFDVSDMAADLEEASKSIEHHDLSEETNRLLSVYRSLHQKIKSAMTECQRDEVQQKRIEDAYATLKDYADTEDTDLIELILGAMEHYDMPREDADRFGRIRQYLLNFDFDAIKKTLEEV